MKSTPPHVGGADARNSYGEEVSLSELLLVLWHYWFLVVGVGIAAGILAFLISWNRTPVFQASSRLLVSPQKTAGEAQSRPPVSAATYVALISNQSLVLEALTDLRLTEPPHRLTAAEALQRNVSVQAVGTEIILITTRLGDPALAAQFANRLAERSVQFAQQFAQDDLIGARDSIKARLDESHRRMEEAESRLLAYRKKAQFEALTAEVDVLVEERARLLPLLVQIEAERARIRQTTEELARHTAVPTARGSVTPPVAVRESANSPDPQRRPQPDESDPSRDRVSETLIQQLSASRMKLSELESQRAEILRATDLTKAGARKLNELYATEAELDRLYRETSLAREAYWDVAAEYEQTRAQTESRHPQIQIIDSAVPSTRPVSPRTFRDMTVAVLVAVVLASVAVLLYSAVAGKQTVAA